MKSLKRTQVGDFKLEDSVTIEELNNIIQNSKSNMMDNTKIKKNDNEKMKNVTITEILKNKIISVESIFKNSPSIELDNRKLELFLNGVMLTQNFKDGVYKIYNRTSCNTSRFIGTGTIKDKLLKRDIIL